MMKGLAILLLLAVLVPCRARAEGQPVVADVLRVSEGGPWTVDGGLVLALPTTLGPSLSTGFGLGVLHGGTFAWGARASWSTATESSIAWTVTQWDLRLRLEGAIQRRIGRARVGLRLGLGPTVIHETRDRNQSTGATTAFRAVTGRRGRGIRGATHLRSVALHVERRTECGCRSRRRSRRLGHAHRGGVAALMRARLALLAVAVGGCNNLQGVGGPVPPLVQFNVEVTGDVTSLGVPSNASLQVALVWGAQWLTEPFCILPPESPAAAAVIAAGCRDPFGFVPARVTASVPVTVGTPATLPLYEDPSTDLLVGSITSRVGYASLVFYDDVDRDGALGLSESHPTATGGHDGPDESDNADSPDVVYGASFVTMTAPDQRVAFLQGTFDRCSRLLSAQWLPRASRIVLGARHGRVHGGGGVGGVGGRHAPGRGPSSCSTNPPDTLISVVARAPDEVEGVDCQERTLDGTTRYRQPPADAPDFTGRNDRLREPTRIRHGNAAQAHSARRIRALDRPLQGTDPLHPPRMPRRRVLRGPRLGLHRQSACLVAVLDSLRTASISTTFVIALALAGSARAEEPNAPPPPAPAAAADAAPPPAAPPPAPPAAAVTPVAPLAPPAATVAQPGAEEAEGEPKLSLPTEADRDAWRRAGFRLGLAVSYGELVGLEGAPNGRLLGFLVRLGIRLDGDWSLIGSLQYARATSTGGIDGLRFAGTLDPTWHVTNHLSLAVGLGFGGIVEGSTSRPEIMPLPGSLANSYSFPSSKSAAPELHGGRPGWPRARRMDDRAGATVGHQLRARSRGAVDRLRG